MKDELLIYALLARGLLDIRLAAHENNSKTVFRLADLLHNVPSHISKVREEGKDFSEVLESLRSRAKLKGLVKWLDHAIAEAQY